MLGLVLHGLMEYELSLKFLQNALNLTLKYHGPASLKHAHRFVKLHALSNAMNVSQYFLFWFCCSYPVLFLNFHLYRLNIFITSLHVCLLCSHHLLATVYESKGDFRSALQHEKEAYSIYENQVRFMMLQICFLVLRLCFMLMILTDILAHVKVGVNHNSTKESSEYLKSLTQQAVILQKAINHIYSNIPSASIPPPKVCLLSTWTYACKQDRTCLFTFVVVRYFLCVPLQFSTPSLSIVLQQLNLTCGIILIPFRWTVKVPQLWHQK